MKLKRTPFPKRSIVSTLSALILLSLFWASQALTTVQLPKSDEPPKLYSNQTQDDLKQLYLKAFSEAKESILLIIYALNDSQIIEILKQKAEAGTDVQVICDAKASKGVNRRLGPKVKILKRSAVGLMHQKIAVIDRHECLIGSANMTKDSLQLHGNLVTGMDHPAVAELIYDKSAGMSKTGRASPWMHRDFLLAGQKMELWFLPDDPQAIWKLLTMIGQASQKLRIAMFTWTHPKLTQAVIDAHHRGLDVQVVIDYYAGKGSSAEVFQRLKEAGVAVKLSPGGALLHYKFLSVDDSDLVNGSANWTRAAFTQNDDCFIVLHDLNDEQRKFLGSLWKAIWAEAQ